MTELESCVIVTNKYASIATIRFSDSSKDKIISSTNKNMLYTLIEQTVKNVQEQSK